MLGEAEDEDDFRAHKPHAVRMWSDWVDLIHSWTFFFRLLFSFIVFMRYRSITILFFFVWPTKKWISSGDHTHSIGLSSVLHKKNRYCIIGCGTKPPVATLSCCTTMRVSKWCPIESIYAKSVKKVCVSFESYQWDSFFGHCLSISLSRLHITVPLHFEQAHHIVRKQCQYCIWHLLQISAIFFLFFRLFNWNVRTNHRYFPFLFFLDKQNTFKIKTIIEV